MLQPLKLTRRLCPVYFVIKKASKLYSTAQYYQNKASSHPEKEATIMKNVHGKRIPLDPIHIL